MTKFDALISSLLNEESKNVTSSRLNGLSNKELLKTYKKAKKSKDPRVQEMEQLLKDRGYRHPELHQD